MSVLYITGMPATGKSSVTDIIQKLAPDIEIIRYSNILRDELRHQEQIEYTTRDLREKSSSIVTLEHIKRLDSRIADHVKESKSPHIILESHAITVEEYGYRATPFSIETLKKINPNLIVVLFDDPNRIKSRIAVDAQGRQLRDAESIAYGQALQSSLALQYSFILGAEILFMDVHHTADYIAKCILDKIRIA